MAKKIILTSLLVIVGIIVTGFFYLNGIYIPQHLKPIVIQTLETGLKKKVTIENASYFPFKGVLFSKVSIRNSDMTPFIDVETVDFSLKSFPSVKAGKISGQARLIIRNIAVQQQRLTVKGSSVVNLDLQSADKESVFFNALISLENLEIRGLSPVSDITRIQGDISCSQDSFSGEKLSAVIGNQTAIVSFKGGYDKNSVTLEQGRLNYGKTNFSLNGKVNNLQNPRIDAIVQGSLDLSDVPKLLSGLPLPQLSGICAINASAQGVLNDIGALGAKLKAEIPAGSADAIKFSDVKAECELKQGAVYATPLKCVFYGGTVSGTVKAVVTKVDIPVNGALEVSKINIGPLVRDILKQDVGSGTFNAHAEISGSAIDPDTLTGSGWFRLLNAAAHMPSNFTNVARGLKVPQLSGMEIHESSATFSISEGKVSTQDFIAVADIATVSRKGYVDLDQYVDFEALFRLSAEFAQKTGMGQLGGFVSDTAGIPIAKIKLYDKIPRLKWKAVPLPVGDVLKDSGKELLLQGLKGLLNR